MLSLRCACARFTAHLLSPRPALVWMARCAPWRAAPPNTLRPLTRCASLARCASLERCAPWRAAPPWCAAPHWRAAPPLNAAPHWRAAFLMCFIGVPPTTKTGVPGKGAMLALPTSSSLAILLLPPRWGEGCQRCCGSCTAGTGYPSTSGERA